MRMWTWWRSLFRRRVADPWGVELVLDLYGCDPHRIVDGRLIRQFAADLVARIDMIAHGDPVVERFALDNPEAAGFSLVQLITTSSITAHFAEESGRAFVNIFSCKAFDTAGAERFVREYFGAKSCRARVLDRS